jgi:hypothetical protein
MTDKVNRFILNPFFILFNLFGSFFILYKLHIINSFFKLSLTFFVLLIIFALWLRIKVYKEFILNLLSISNEEKFILNSYEKVYNQHYNEEPRKNSIKLNIVILYFIILLLIFYFGGIKQYFLDYNSIIYISFVYCIWIYILSINFYTLSYFDIVYFFINRTIDRIDDKTINRLKTNEDFAYSPIRELDLSIPPIKDIYNFRLKDNYEIEYNEIYPILYLIGLFVLVLVCYFSE